MAVSLKESITTKHKKPEDGGIAVFDASKLLESNTIEDELQTSTHIIAVFNKNPAWLPYISGFAAGKGSVLVCINGNNSAIPAVYTKGDHVFTSNNDFLVWFGKEKLDFLVREKKSKGKEALLLMGIPVTPDAFAAAIAEGNEKTVQLFLDAGFSPDDCNKTGVPMLCLAARAGKFNIIQKLLDNKAGVNKKSLDRGNTAIIDAALGKYSGIIEVLIKAGADVNVKSKDGQSALIMAVNLDDEETAKILLKAGADPDASDSLGASAKKYAALFHKTAMLALFDKYA